MVRFFRCDSGMASLKQGVNCVATGNASLGVRVSLKCQEFLYENSKFRRRWLRTLSFPRQKTNAQQPPWDTRFWHRYNSQEAFCQYSQRPETQFRQQPNNFTRLHPLLHLQLWQCCNQAAWSLFQSETSDFEPSWQRKETVSKTHFDTAKVPFLIPAPLIKLNSIHISRQV